MCCGLREGSLAVVEPDIQVLFKKSVPNNDVEIVVVIKIDHDDFYTGTIGAQRRRKTQFFSSAQPEFQKCPAQLEQIWLVVTIKIGIAPVR